MERWAELAGGYQISSDGLVMNKRGKILADHWSRDTGYNYAQMYLDRKVKTVSIHRLLATAFIPNPDNLQCVDHIDRDRTNNDLSNLRWATTAQNQANRAKADGCTSRYKGVSWSTRDSHWVARIGNNRHGDHYHKFRQLGRYRSEDDAARAYNAAALERYGEFAQLNEVAHA
jgi:hypothetical protein